MIRFLMGENSFAIRRALQEVIAHLNVPVERLDGAELDRSQLIDALSGTSLFQPQRLVVISQLSENTALWTELSELVARIPAENEIVFIDAKPDKRTTSFKTLKAAAETSDYPLWGERDRTRAEGWLLDEAKQLAVPLTKPLARLVIDRVGVHQEKLYRTLEKLSLLDDLTVETIEETIELTPGDNVFVLFDLALSGQAGKLHAAMASLAQTEDAYKLFGLLGSQVFQLAAVCLAEEGDDPATALGIHPFVLSKLARYKRSLTRADLRRIVRSFAEADAALKLSTADPWLLIERALLKVAQ